MNFANYRLCICENIFHECLVFVDKDRVIALIREIIIREMLYLAHSRKISPVKIFHYIDSIEQNSPLSSTVFSFYRFTVKFLSTNYFDERARSNSTHSNLAVSVPGIRRL